MPANQTSKMAMMTLPRLSRVNSQILPNSNAAAKLPVAARRA